MSDSNLSRRDFGRGAVGYGLGLPLGGRPHVRKSPLPPLTDRLFQAAGRVGRTTKFEFWSTDDLAPSAGIPVVGVHHHLWVGNCGQFRGESCLVAGLVAGRVCELLGSPKYWDSFVSFCRDFYGSDKIATDSPALVFVCKGHVTTRHAFAQNRCVADNLRPSTDDVTVLPVHSRREKMVLHFGGGWPGYKTRFALPNNMRAPGGRSDVALVRRRRLRAYRAPNGLMLPSKDFIVQYSTADRDPLGQDLRTIREGGYYPNSEPFRRPLNERGYTDSSSVVFVRVVGRAESRYAHQVNVNFNLGLIRRGLAAEDESNPEEVLDINTVVRPVGRVFDQYSALRDVLEANILSRT